MRKLTLFIGSLLAVVPLFSPASAEAAELMDRAERTRRPARAETPSAPETQQLRYRVIAENPRLNRRLMGPTRRWVQGVPADPVDSMCWNGEGSVPVKGTFRLVVEPMRNVGRISAEWTDSSGTWTYEQTRFIHPDHHSSGVRIGSSVQQVEDVINEGIAVNVYLHGDTAAGMPVLPTVFTYLAAWGPADVTLNDQVFRNPFEIPAPQWLGHIMVTEGARRPDGTVRTLTGEIYNPSQGGNGAVEPGDLEVHLTFHDDLFPNTGNIPPPFSFFYHLVFEDVRIEQIQADPTEDFTF